MTKFKDVAHLYMGCKAEVTSLEDGVKHIDSIEWVSRDSVELKTWGSFHFENDTLASIKLILRPLSDMTVDVANEILKIRDMDGIYKTECILDLVKESLMSKKWPNNFNAASKITIYLISKHFDLFGLIESGEAIDATTLTDGELESGLSGKL